MHKGASVEVIGKMPGHSDIRTTQKYVQVNLEAAGKAANVPVDVCDIIDLVHKAVIDSV